MTNINNLFFERLKKIYSQDDIQIIKNGLNIKKRNVSFRVNTLKSNEEEVINALNENNLKFRKLDFLENSFVLLKGREKDLWNLDIFKSGKIYMQSISSQIPVYFLDLKVGDKVLDVTAAPGSKTSQISSILDNTGEIIANDNNQIRIDKLKFTCERQGVKNVKIIKNDARNLGNILQKEYFDSILADLPCSAEGRICFSKEKSFGFWSEKSIKRNYKLQKEILLSIVSLLKVGGVLVYSTCTLAPEENEGIVHFLLSNFKNLEIEEINLDYENTRSGITKFGDVVYNKNVSKSIRCLPSEDTEGFFVAKFRKSSI